MLLSLQNVSLKSYNRNIETTFLDSINLDIESGEAIGIIGETGSGKSVTCYSALKLLPKTAEIGGGNISLNGEDITHASEDRLREIRGGEIGIIFQDP